MIKTHRRILIVLLGIMMSLACLVGLVACSPRESDDWIVCRFHTYDDHSIIVTGYEGTAVTFPIPTREGYAFDGWYATEDLSGEPVTSALFTVNTDYYAKWTKAYPAELDLDGGTLSAGDIIYIREGANIANAMKDYVPYKEGYQFGGWYVDGKELSANEIMTENGIMLTARYKARYTVNVYLQNLAQDGYDYQADYASDYALIGEEFTLPIAVPGFEIVTEDIAKLIRTIDADASKNVFELRFDRETFTLFYNSNYPDGTQKTTTVSYLYGYEFDVPATTEYAYEGCRFVGWSLSADGGYDDIINTEKYSLDGNTIFYAVWNKGYKDMFGGKDYIYVSPSDSNSAVICRAGIDIPGTYYERGGYYNFNGTYVDENNIQFRISAKLNDNGTFYYQIFRTGTYVLYENGRVDESVKITFKSTNADELTYDRAGEKLLDGKFTVDANGVYTVVFNDGTTMAFMLGTVTTQDGSSSKNVFRIRGDEYAYGMLPRLDKSDPTHAYYPIIELDGFGNAFYISINSSGQETVQVISYTIKGDIITLSMSNSSQTVRIVNYGVATGYDIYDENYDVKFWVIQKGTQNTLNNEQLVLDGCATAEVLSSTGSVVFSGAYSVAMSILGDQLLTVVSGSEVRLYRLAPSDSHWSALMLVARELEASYGEYYYADTEGSLSGEPYLIDNGDGTASLYVENGSSLVKATDGTLVENTNSGTYVFIGEDAVNGIRSFELRFDVWSSYPIYYWLNSTADGETDKTDYTVTYDEEGGKGGTLTIASANFGIFTKDGVTVTGVCAKSNTDGRIMRLAVTVGANTAYYYFMYDDADAPTSFKVLASEPLVLYHRKNNTTDRSMTLNVTGELFGDDTDKFVAIYNDGTNSAIDGYFTEEIIEELGISAAVNYFYNSAGVLQFKFVLASSGSTLYFEKFEENEIITILTLTGLDDSDANDSSQTLALTSDKHTNGKYIVEYKADADAVSVRGTLTSTYYSAFNEYDIVVYTFTSTDGLTTFEFTLLSRYFRMSAGMVSYSSKDGKGTLVLDGYTHIARYTDAYGVKHDGAYLLDTSILDEDELAVCMYIDDELRYFDLDGDTFTLRGLEAASYLVVDNGYANNRMITFDGHGNAEIRDLVILNGTYTKTDATHYTVTVDSVVYSWTLDTAEKKVTITYDSNSKSLYGDYATNTANTAFNLVIDNVSYLCYLTASQNNANAGDIEISYYNLTKEGEYTISADGDYTISDNNGVEICRGILGIVDVDGSYYNTFVLYTREIAGAYLNESDLSAIVLDNYGNATYYDSYGMEDTGYYIRITDDIFYFENDAGTNAAMYTRNSATKKVTANTFNRTFYAADMSSIVLYVNGIASFDNSTGVFFSYDETAKKIYIYDRDSEGDKNEYGFVKTEFQIGNNDTVSYNEKTYYLFSGRELTFTDADGATLKFTPTGAATFMAVATYTYVVEDKEYTERFYVCVDYVDDEVQAYVAFYGNVGIGGSSNEYTVLVNQDLTLTYSGADESGNTFIYDPDQYVYGLTAYDYSYMSVLATYGQTITQMLFSRLYGAIAIMGEDSNDGSGVKYTVAGQFNFVTYTDGTATRTLTFEDGTLSDAGYYNSNYGHMFTSQFIGSDGKTYVLNFFIVYNNYFGNYNYIIFSLTELGETPIYNGGSYKIYEQTFIYTTGFQIFKGQGDDGEDEYYGNGDKYFPILVIDGVAVCDIGYVAINDTTWQYYVRVYDGSRYYGYNDSYYTFTFEWNGEGDNRTIKANSGKLEIRKQIAEFYTVEGSNSTGVLAYYNEDSGEIEEIYAIVNSGYISYVSGCVKLEDGSYIVTVSNNTSMTISAYKIAFENKSVDSENYTYAVVDSTVNSDVLIGEDDNKSLLVCLDADGNVIAVLAVKYGDSAEFAESSSKSGNVYTVTTEDGNTYTVTVIEPQDDESERTFTIELVEG